MQTGRETQQLTPDLTVVNHHDRDYSALAAIAAISPLRERQIRVDQE